MNRVAFILLGVLVAAVSANAVERFPPPQFTETQHQLPSPTIPEARSGVWEVVDAVVLGGMLLAVAWLALRVRRRWPLALGVIVAVAWFGFWRQGCICPVGAVQNVAAGLAGQQVVAGVVIVFFVLPILASLFFGRVFCAAVCPLGAIQDVVIARPVRVPTPLEHALGLGAWVVLTLAVLLAATGSGYVVCRYDPFVGFFRLGGFLPLLLVGLAVLLIGVVIARPYCRYLCPLGAIFRVTSQLSRHHVSITPEQCISCRLCEDACPFGAIDKPTPPQRESTARGKRRLGLLLLAAPLIVLVGLAIGWQMGEPLADTHRTVQLADRLQAERAGRVEGTTFETDAFRRSGRPFESLVRQASAKRDQFRWATLLAGGFLGLVVALKLISLATRRTRTDYTPNRSRCLSCGRCFAACPYEQLRRKEARP